MMNSQDYDNQGFPNLGGGDEEGISRAHDLEAKLLSIAEIAAECEFEYIGPQTADKYYELLADCAMGKYEPQTATDFFPSINSAIETVFGDLQSPFYEVFVTQIIQDVFGFYVEMYIYFLKMAFLQAIEHLLPQKSDSAT